MRRRDLLALFGAAVALRPAGSRADQAKLPVVGCLHSASPDYLIQFAGALREGLAESGYVDGRNVTIEYRWAGGSYERLAPLAAELVRDDVSVILAMGGTGPAKAAMAATDRIPIVFVSAADPIQAGLVASLSQPGGNVTGVSLIASALDSKKFGFLHELAPKATKIGSLINPDYPGAQAQRLEVEETARQLGLEVVIFLAATDAELDMSFSNAVQQNVGALIVGTDPFFNSRSSRLIALAQQRRLPVIYPQREYVRAGGLMSYGPNFAEGYRNGGIYVGKILAGAKPDALPVMQPTKFELIVNLQTARALGLALPPTLLATADEVVE